MTTRRWTACWLALVWAFASGDGVLGRADGPGLAKGTRCVVPFDYHGVALEGGPLRAALDQVRLYCLRIPNDDLLKGFRQRAGLPAPGQDLGGWYTADTFHVFGQIVSGLARLYAASGDPTCKAKADVLVAEWTRCISPDGYFCATAKPNAPHYIYDKIVGGLVDDALYCGNRTALKHLIRITDWAIRHQSGECSVPTRK
jgi:uncharacterized protein